MGWAKGGFVGIIIGLLVEAGLFFGAHLCQVFSVSNAQGCGIFVIPFSSIAGLIPLNVKLGYIISMLAALLIFAIIGAIVGKIKDKS